MAARRNELAKMGRCKAHKSVLLPLGRSDGMENGIDGERQRKEGSHGPVNNTKDNERRKVRWQLKRVTGIKNSHGGNQSEEDLHFHLFSSSLQLCKGRREPPSTLDDMKWLTVDF